jgi:hypothetical protein
MSVSDNFLEKLAPSMTNGRIVVEYDMDKYFDQIEASFPIYGSKIEWDEVDGSVEELARLEFYSADCTNFFNKMTEQFIQNPDSKVVLLGDSAMDYALLTSLKNVPEVLEKMLELPQHHFIVANNFSWCISFSMEGDMAFGFAKQ